MGQVNYLKDVPLDAIALDADTVVLREDIFYQLADYTRSFPTAPSPGRIWRRNLHWSGDPSNWFVYITYGDTTEPGTCWNRGRPVILV